MVVALADIAGLQKVASFTLNNLYQPGDNIHTTYVEDTGSAGESLLHAAAIDLDSRACRLPGSHKSYPQCCGQSCSSAFSNVGEPNVCEKYTMFSRKVIRG